MRVGDPQQAREGNAAMIRHPAFDQVFLLPQAMIAGIDGTRRVQKAGDIVIEAGRVFQHQGGDGVPQFGDAEGMPVIEIAQRVQGLAGGDDPAAAHRAQPVDLGQAGDGNGLGRQAGRDRSALRFGNVVAVDLVHDQPEIMGLREGDQGVQLGARQGRAGRIVQIGHHDHACGRAQGSSKRVHVDPETRGRTRYMADLAAVRAGQAVEQLEIRRLDQDVIAGLQQGAVDGVQAFRSPRGADEGIARHVIAARQGGDRIGISAHEGAGIAACHGFGESIGNQFAQQGFRFGNRAVEQRPGFAGFIAKTADDLADPVRIAHEAGNLSGGGSVRTGSVWVVRRQALLRAMKNRGGPDRACHRPTPAQVP